MFSLRNLAHRAHAYAAAPIFRASATAKRDFSLTYLSSRFFSATPADEPFHKSDEAKYVGMTGAQIFHDMMREHQVEMVL
jgi:hypothetical protein